MDFKENGTPKGRLEELEARTRQYLTEIDELQFAEYLQAMLGRIEKQQQQAELLGAELDRSYQMYLNRVRSKDTVYNEVSSAEKKPAETNSTATRKNGLEFTVGTALLSIVGGTFILTAMVLFGIHFMDGFAKGMCLYAGMLALLLVSEMVLYRKWHKLGAIFSEISLGGLFLSTTINYLTLGNFNMWVAMGITFFIAMLAIALSRRRDSFACRSLGLITCYLCLILFPETGTLQEMLVLTGITLVINIVCICLPLQSKRTGFTILHMYVLGLYTFLLNCRYLGETGTEPASLIVVGGVILILQLLLIARVRYQRKEQLIGRQVGTRGVTVAYFLSGALILLALPGDVIWSGYGIVPWMRHVFVACCVVFMVIAMSVIRKGRELWYPYYYANITAYAVYCMSENDWERVICMAVLLAVVKILSLWKISDLKGLDAVLTTLTCLMCLSFRESAEGFVVVSVLCVLISILFIRYWQTYLEIILTFTLAFFGIAKLPVILQLETFVGILFVGILLFNNVKGWRGTHIRVYNYIVLATQAVCFLLLMSPVYRNAYIVYLCMLVFGLATIIITFQEKYRMDFKQKNLILAIFLTYMAFVIRTNYPVINSILLMLIALVCVGLGFASQEKSVRIYGLVLSLIICGKIALYDFFGAATLQKVLLFLAVGIIALVIATIYIVLEKKTEIKQSE